MIKKKPQTALLPSLLLLTLFQSSVPVSACTLPTTPSKEG